MAPLGNQDNFYTRLNLDPSASSEELGILLAGRDAQFDQYGVPPEAPERRETMVAYGILSKEENRRLYDEAILNHRPLQQYELEHLANFGAWPVIAQPFAAPSYAAHVPEVATPQSPSGPPYAFALPMRASMGMRIWMSVIDTFLAMMLGGAGAVAVEGAGGMFEIAVFGIVMVAYFLVSEVWLGASPAKMMYGYTVRDIDTGKKLTLAQAAKRNWWRLSCLVPGVGPVISGIAALVLVSTITPANGQLGSHDRLGGAEVVRRNR
ncbi:RDD family protein [Corynebacterium epidermidicanis]|uniref:RDD domain-containing protein n=1 Tax=Corynebacterium epidermidicanis TaxID=1050174 RepID=A0A0G3GMH6_9CORY|nr:RDD family protein [Corynebacterium epidermidicanis]AKK02436.1 hypothetical protein CEPID_02780 [Corynebacterium epidermidicanis]